MRISSVPSGRRDDRRRVAVGAWPRRWCGSCAGRPHAGGGALWSGRYGRAALARTVVTRRRQVAGVFSGSSRWSSYHCAGRPHAEIAGGLWPYFGPSSCFSSLRCPHDERLLRQQVGGGIFLGRRRAAVYCAVLTMRGWWRVAFFGGVVRIFSWPCLCCDGRWMVAVLRWSLSCFYLACRPYAAG